MVPVNPLKVSAIVEFVSDDDFRSGAGESTAQRAAERQNAALELAAEVLCPAPQTSVLDPALRARLDAMSKDYARILMRIDRLAVDGKASSGKTGKRWPPICG